MSEDSQSNPPNYLDPETRRRLWARCREIRDETRALRTRIHQIREGINAQRERLGWLPLPTREPDFPWR